MLLTLGSEKQALRLVEQAKIRGDIAKERGSFPALFHTDPGTRLPLQPNGYAASNWAIFSRTSSGSIKVVLPVSR